MKTMTLEEMKLAVCEKLPELISCYFKSDHDNYTPEYWHLHWKKECRPINWPTEGLQICHEAEKLLLVDQRNDYIFVLSGILGAPCNPEDLHGFEWLQATYKQRLEALCRVWFPERWSK